MIILTLFCLGVNKWSRDHVSCGFIFSAAMVLFLCQDKCQLCRFASLTSDGKKFLPKNVREIILI